MTQMENPVGATKASLVRLPSKISQALWSALTETWNLIVRILTWVERQSKEHALVDKLLNLVVVTFGVALGIYANNWNAARHDMVRRNAARIFALDTLLTDRQAIVAHGQTVRKSIDESVALEQRFIDGVKGEPQSATLDAGHYTELDLDPAFWDRVISADIVQKFSYEELATFSMTFGAIREYYEAAKTTKVLALNIIDVHLPSETRTADQIRSAALLNLQYRHSLQYLVGKERQVVCEIDGVLKTYKVHFPDNVEKFDCSGPKSW